jgi:hypothetical protein
MARKIGINQNSIQMLISGARVAFDTRTTAEVCDTRSARNGVAEEAFMRKMHWEQRQREETREAAE